MGIATEYVLEELRLARTGRGLSQDDFGKLISYSGSHVSSVETGQRPPTQPYMAAIDEALETGGRYERMLDKLAKLEITPAWLRQWIEYEREAKLLRWYEPAFMPGLLQTEAYARAILGRAHLTSEAIEHRLRSRLERQAILTADEPGLFVFVLDEMTLRRPIAGQPGVLAEQLAHLTKCIEMPHVQVLVVPQEVGIYPGLQGGFILATLADGTAMGHLDHQVRAQIVTEAGDVATLQETWEAIRSEALPRQQSLDLIKEVAKTWT